MPPVGVRHCSWVFDAAYDIGIQKAGIAYGCFTAGEVVRKLGFSKTTVLKYLTELEQRGAVAKIVVSKSIVIYRVVTGD